MSHLTEIRLLLLKDFRLEWRNKSGLSSILLYMAGTVFVCYLSFQAKKVALTPVVWNTLFWIILLFAAVQAVGRSFLQETEQRFFFYYCTVRPQSVIVAKIIFNTISVLAIGVPGLLAYSLVMGTPVQDHSLFWFNIFLGAISLSGSFTLVAAIASKAANNHTLMAILGFPAVLPLLLMLVKVSKNAMDGLSRSASYDEIMTIFAINLIVMAVSYLLFPYLWKN